MPELLRAVLEILGLVDDDGELSLTQALVYAVAIRFCFASAFSSFDVVIAIMAIVNLMHRRHLRSKRDVIEATSANTKAETMLLKLQDKLDSVDRMEARLNAVSVKMGFSAKV